MKNTHTLQNEIRTHLADHAIVSLWHFTDRSNVASIKEHGILSLNELIDRKMIPEHGASSYLSKIKDLRSKLSRYIHLTFITDHPLYHIALQEKRIVDPVWIEIDLSVIFDPEVRLCAKVANALGTELFGIEDLKNKIDFDIMLHSPEFVDRKEARKAEILVPDRIDPDMIIGVYDG